MRKELSDETGTPSRGVYGKRRGAVYALELSAQRWQLAFGLGLATPSRRRTIAAGDRAALRREIAAAKRRLGLLPTAPVRSCYEAGRDGFWVHRLLTSESIANVVVDSASIEVTRRHRRAKTDRLDADALLRRLIRYWLGERDQWKIVHVPTVEAEDARQAERAIATLVAERTRQRNRIHGLLATHGVRVRITRHFGDRLAVLTTPDGAALPPGMRARVALAWRMLVGIEAELRQARHAQQASVRGADTPAAVRALRLQQLKGLQLGRPRSWRRRSSRATCAIAGKSAR